MEIRRILINPFEDFRDSTLFAVGLIAYLLSSLQVYFFVYVPDGIFQAHGIDRVMWYSGFTNGAINIIVPAIFLYGVGKIVYSKTRFFDVMNVIMIAQIVNYFIALLLLNPFSKLRLLGVAKAIEQGDMMLKTVPALDVAVLSIGGILAFLLLIYFFYLLIVGMKIAINSKKTIHVLLIVVLVLALDTILHLVYPYV